MAEPKRVNYVSVVMNDDELRMLDDWRFERRIGSRSEAVRVLVVQGLGATHVAIPGDTAGDWRRVWRGGRASYIPAGQVAPGDAVVDPVIFTATPPAEPEAPPKAKRPRKGQA